MKRKPNHRLFIDGREPFISAALFIMSALYLTSVTSHSGEVSISLLMRIDNITVEDNSGSTFVDSFTPETGAVKYTSNEVSGGMNTNALSARLYAEARYESGFLKDPEATVNVNIRDILTVGHGLENGNMGIMRFRYNVTGNLENDVNMTPPAGAYGLADWSLRTRLSSGGFDETRGGSLRTDTGASGDAIPGIGLTLSYDLPITFGTQFEFHREFETNAMIDSNDEDLGAASWTIGSYLHYSFNYMGADFLVSDGNGGFTQLDNNDISVIAASGADYRYAGSAPAEVPEPSPGLLSLLGGIVILWYRRNQR